MRARLRNRRGATMVLVGVALVAMVGVMAFAIDFGRMYLFKAQVHVSSDAAALAGAERMMRGQTASAADTAVAYGRLNLVERVTPAITTSDVEPGAWDFATGTFTASGSWTAATNTAVRATARYTASYGFGRFFGFSTRLRTATSVAAIGGVGAADCVRPLSIPYRDVLNALPGGTGFSLSHNLTAAEVSLLAGATLTVPLLSGVQLPPKQYANGSVPSGGTWGTSAPAFQNGLSATCAQLGVTLSGYTSNPFVGIGDWLEDAPGVMTSASSAVEALCKLSGYGGTTPPNPNNNSDFNCNAPVPVVKMAIWDQNVSALAGVGNCRGSGCYRVRYLGAVAISGYRKSGKVTLATFTATTSGGSFSFAPGPVKKIALVQ